jgi:Flp pilus assembly pilin Flp
VSYEGGTEAALQRGQSLVEYALIIAFVAVLAIASLLIFRPEISSVLSNLSSSV